MQKYQIIWIHALLKNGKWEIYATFEEKSIYGEYWNFKTNGNNPKRSFLNGLHRHGIYADSEKVIFKGNEMYLVKRKTDEPIIKATPIN